MLNPDHRLAIRATPDDFQALEAIAAHMRVTGTPFANRTDAVRFALRMAAQATHNTTTGGSAHV